MAAIKRSGWLNVIFRALPRSTIRRHSKITSSSKGKIRPPKPGSQPVSKPNFEFLPKYRVCLALNPETDFGKRHAAEKETIRRLYIRPCLHAAVGSGLPQLGYDIGVK